MKITFSIINANKWEKALFLVYLFLGILFGSPLKAWSEPVSIEGTLQVRVIDRTDKKEDVQYFLQPNGQDPFILATKEAITLKPGTRIRVRGNKVGSTIAVEAIEKINVMQPMEVLGSPVVGQRKVAVILVNFQNDTRTPYDLNYAKSMMFTTVNNWFKEVSYGKVSLVGSVSPAGDVFGWYTLPMNAPPHTPSYSEADLIWSQVVATATFHGINLPSYDHVWVVFPLQSYPWAGLAYLNNQRGFCNGDYGLRVTPHEMGHNLGLLHANRLECGSAVIGSPMNNSLVCQNIEYEDPYDMMGNGFLGVGSHFNPEYKEELGWLDSNDLPEVTQSSVISLNAYELSGSQTKAVKVNSVVEGQDVTYYLEYRRKIGFDSWITDSRTLNGVLLRMYSSQPIVSKYFNTVLLDSTPGTASYLDSALMVGESYTEPGGLKFTPLSHDGSTLQLQIEFDPLIAAGEINFVSSTYWVAEDQGFITLRVERKLGTAGAVSVDYGTQEGSALAGPDYTTTSGTINFIDGEGGIKSFDIPINDDTESEETETFSCLLSNPTNGVVIGARSEATIVINDNDVPDIVVQFENNRVSVKESSPTVTLTLTFNTPGITQGKFFVNYFTTDGTAKSGEDYRFTSEMLEIDPRLGTTQDFTIDIFEDAIEEPTETFTVGLRTESPGVVIGQTSPAIVSILDNDGTNHPPQAHDQTVEGDEDSAFAIVLTAEDEDLDPLTYSTVSSPSHGIITGQAPNLTYRPAANYFGSDQFTFKARDAEFDSNVATITINVKAVNDAPEARSQEFNTLEDTPVALTLEGTDIENDPLSFHIVSGPGKGALSGVTPNISYTPNPDSNGDDRFTYKVRDASLDSAVATITIHVQAVNDPPVATNKTITVDKNQPAAVLLEGTDVDGDTLQYEIKNSPDHGAISGTPPFLTYTPDLDYLGLDTLQFTVRDGQYESEVATITINVVDTPDQTPPQIQIQTPQENEAVMGTVPVEAQASDNVGIDRVEFYLDQTLIGIVTDATYAITFQASNYAIGPHMLRAKALDKAGNQDEDAVNIIIMGVAGENELKNIFNPLRGEEAVFAVPIVMQTTQVELAVRDQRGALVHEFTETRNPGDATVSWNGRNSQNHVVSDGVYSIRIKYESQIFKNKAVVIK